MPTGCPPLLHCAGIPAAVSPPLVRRSLHPWQFWSALRNKAQDNEFWHPPANVLCLLVLFREGKQTVFCSPVDSRVAFATAPEIAPASSLRSPGDRARRPDLWAPRAVGCSIRLPAWSPAFWSYTPRLRRSRDRLLAPAQRRPHRTTLNCSHPVLSVAGV